MIGKQWLIDWLYIVLRRIVNILSIKHKGKQWKEIRYSLTDLLFPIGFFFQSNFGNDLKKCHQ